MLSNIWLQKFAAACHGCWLGIRHERSIAVHLSAASMVMIAAAYFRVTTVEWCLVSLAIALVISLELLNSAVERLAKTITRERHPEIGAALDLAAAGVLIATCGAIVVGIAIFGTRVWTLIFPLG